ncbi:MAG: response regulator transcription factor, partial [Anaerolineales bacterium]|nr:response regulator transcription factor [Anaerolineales bacterium]
TEQEKDRLLTAVSQQSEQLRKMTTWLIESQQQGHHATIVTYQQIQQDLSLAHSNLAVIQSTLPPDVSPIISNHLENTLKMLTKIENYLKRADTTIRQSNQAKQEMAANPLLVLSTREREVMQLLAKGKSNADIAELLSVTPATIHTYTKRIRNKLDIPDLPSLIKFAIEQNLSG